MGLGGQRVLGGGRAPGREHFPGAPAPCRFLHHLGDSGYLGRGEILQHRAAAPPALPAPRGLQIPLSWNCAPRQSRGRSVPALREGKVLPSLPAEWLKLAAYCTVSQWVPAGHPFTAPHNTSPGEGERWLSCSQHPGEGQAGEPQAGKQHLPVSQGPWRAGSPMEKPPTHAAHPAETPSSRAGTGREGANK